MTHDATGNDTARPQPAEQPQGYWTPGRGQQQGPYGQPGPIGGWMPGYQPGYPSTHGSTHGAGPTQGPGQPPGQKPSRRSPLRQALPALLAAAVVVAAGAGVVVGHYAWPQTNLAAGAPVAAHQTTPSGGSNSGDGGDANPNNTGDGSGGNNQRNNSQGNNGGNNGRNDSQGGGRFNGMVPFGLIPRALLPGSQQAPGSGRQPQGSESGRITSAPGAPSNIAAIAKKVDSGVVDINVQFSYQQAAGAGTGIVLSSDGDVLTNNHVIDGATAIAVTDLGNGKTYHASVVGYDPSADIAMLHLKNATGLKTAHIADSKTVETGEPVVGIGNAGGVGGTPSAAGGSVTALNKSITVGDEMYGTTEHLTGLIETNADIRSGDSGGPLVTKSGAVIGMDTAASIGETAATSGHVGFAIPIDTAEKVLSTIESGNGTAKVHVGPTAALGVLVQSGQQPGNEPGSQFGQQGAQQASGAAVAGVIADGAGAHVGLQVGDVITALDGHQISSASQLTSLMTKYHPGDSVKLGWRDPNGQTHTQHVTLGTGPAA